jgi:hypothetical protein
MTSSDDLTLRDRILERVERRTGVPGLAGLLADRLSSSELTSLLLEVHRRRAAGLTPARVLAAYERDRFARPSGTPPERLLAFERAALACLPPGFEALALSPLCPLGTTSALGGLDQDRAVATSRGTEVVSDATNVLALEAASRRRAWLREDPRSAREAHLAAGHRLVRPHPPSEPRQLPHFSLFGLASAGRGAAGYAFEAGALAAHARFHVALLRAALGPDVPLRLTVSDFSGRDRWDLVESGVLEPVRAGFAGLEAQRDEARSHGRGYYSGFALHVFATRPDGEEVFLADGGEVPWAAALTGSARERLFISGVGAERACSAFPGAVA